MTMRPSLAFILGLTLAAGGLATATAIAAPPSSASKSSKKWKGSKAPKVANLSGKASLQRLNPGAKVITGTAAGALELPPSHNKDALEAIEGPDPSKWSKERIAQAAQIDPSQIVQMTEIAIGSRPHFWTSGTKVQTSVRNSELIRDDAMLSYATWSRSYLEQSLLQISVTRFKPGITLMLSCELDAGRHVEVHGLATGRTGTIDWSPQTVLAEVSVDSRRTHNGEELTELHVVATPRAGDKRLDFVVGAQSSAQGVTSGWSYRPGDCTVSELGG